MTVATQRRMSLEEFLTYDDGTDRRYELVDGVLVEMGAESTINTQIAGFLYGFFILMGVPSHLIGFKQKIEVRSGYVTARDPDLVVHTEESEAAIYGLSEACLKLYDPNPSIVIEVVSPGPESSDNYQRDYVQKPREYADRGIPEMWLIDPARSVVKVGALADGAYDFAEFTGDSAIASPSFPTLNLTAAQVLTAGR
ncbi:MAG: Uma2 family endonuclease [Alkalinema sp. RU_4_3]|nr:Uma2 family endonuclease [Alkalinema sp. RU_4_3]